MINHVASKGCYVIEDIFSSCREWDANEGSHNNRKIKGTPGCMQDADGKPTILNELVRWERLLSNEKVL